MLNFIMEVDSGVSMQGVLGNGRTYGHGMLKIASAFWSHGRVIRPREKLQFQEGKPTYNE
jgi:hypothetical protein